MNSKPQYLDVVFIHRVFKMATVAIVTNQILKYKTILTYQGREVQMYKTEMRTECKKCNLLYMLQCAYSFFRCA